MISNNMALLYLEMIMFDIFIKYTILNKFLFLFVYNKVFYLSK